MEILIHQNAAIQLPSICQNLAAKTNFPSSLKFAPSLSCQFYDQIVNVIIYQFKGSFVFYFLLCFVVYKHIVISFCNRRICSFWCNPSLHCCFLHLLVLCLISQTRFYYFTQIRTKPQLRNHVAKYVCLIDFGWTWLL